MTSDDHDRYAMIDGIRLHYREWGESGSRPLFLLHGSRGHCRSFDAAALRLAESFHVFAPSMRGHGDSAWDPGRRYDFVTLASDVSRLQHALGLPAIHVVGASFGGIVGAWFGAAFPAQLDRFVILDIGPPSPAQFAARPEKLPPPIIGNTREDYLAKATALIDDHKFFVHQATLQEDGTWQSRFDRAFYDDNWARPAPAVMWEQFEAVAAPTLLLRGGESDLLERNVAVAMTTRMPDCRLIEVTGAPHAIPWADWAPLALDFLQVIPN